MTGQRITIILPTTISTIEDFQVTNSGTGIRTDKNLILFDEESNDI